MCSEWLLPKRFKREAKRSRLQNRSKHNCTSLSKYWQYVSVSSTVQDWVATRHLPYVRVHIHEYFPCNNPQQQQHRLCRRFSYSVCMLPSEIRVKKWITSPYITRLLAILVLTVLIDVRMWAQDIDHVWAPKLTGKVEWCFKALGHTDKQSNIQYEHSPLSAS